MKPLPWVKHGVAVDPVALVARQPRRVQFTSRDDEVARRPSTLYPVDRQLTWEAVEVAQPIALRKAGSTTFGSSRRMFESVLTSELTTAGSGGTAVQFGV